MCITREAHCEELLEYVYSVDNNVTNLDWTEFDPSCQLARTYSAWYQMNPRSGTLHLHSLI